MNKLIRYILALPKTIYVNLCLFEIRDAIRLPVIVSGNTIIGKLHKGAIKLQKKIFPRRSNRYV